MFYLNSNYLFVFEKMMYCYDSKVKTTEGPLQSCSLTLSSSGRAVSILETVIQACVEEATEETVSCSL